MQPGRPGFQQLFAHFGDHFLTELADAVGVVTVSFQLLADPARNFRSTHIREPHQAGEVDDGHDARHHRNGDAHLLQAVDEVEVTVGVEEVLGDGAVGTGLYFAREVLQVFLGVAGLGVELGVGGHFQVEVIAAVLPDEFHQLVGVTQLTGGAHARGQVAAQGDNPVDAVLFVHIQQLADLCAGSAHAGQMRCCGNALLVQVQHRFNGAVPGGTAGAEGDREKVRIHLCQLVAYSLQLLLALIGLGREKLEAEAAFELLLGFHDRFRLVPVAFRLVRAFDRYADVFRLVRSHLGDHATKAFHHGAGHFFVQLLGQYLNVNALGLGLFRQVGKLALEQVHLGQHLVGERAVHDAGRVAGGVAQVHQAAFGQQDQVVVGSLVAVDQVYLGFNLVPFPVLAHVGGVDFVIEVADVAHHGAALQGFQHVRVTHVDVTGGGDQQVSGAQQVFVDALLGAGVDAVDVGRHHFKAVHACLHGADRVRFGDLHNHAFLAQGQGGTLAHVAVTDHQRFFARQQVVGSALDSIVQAVTTTVLVVVLGLGHRVVDVDGRDLQGAVTQHFLQAMHAGGGLFGHAVALGDYLRVFLMQQLGQVAAVVQDHVRLPAVYVRTDGFVQAPFVFFVSLTFPREHGNALRRDSGCSLILGGEDVARRPAHISAQLDQCFNQHGSLDGHVDAAHDVGAFQRLLGFVLLTQFHQGGHFAFGDLDFLAAPVGEFDVADFVIVEIVRSAHVVLLSCLKWLATESTEKHGRKRFRGKSFLLYLFSVSFRGFRGQKVF